MTEVMLIPQLAYLLGSKVGIFPIVRTFDFSQGIFKCISSSVAIIFPQLNKSITEQ